jgi:HK97 family phage major capsid protein
MSNYTVINNRIGEWMDVISQLEVLDSKPKLNDQETRTRATLLAKASLMKQGISGDDIARAQCERLRAELGIPEQQHIPHLRVTNPRAVAEWRSMVSDSVRYKRMVAEGEIRVNEAGTQSISYSDPIGTSLGQPGAGGAFVPFGFDERQDVLMSKYNLDAIVMPPYCTEFTTGRGNPCTTPVVDDFALSNSPASINASSIVSENSLDTEKDIVVGKVAWQETPTWRSGQLFVSWELFHDAQYGVEGVAGLIEAVIARRHAIGLGQAMISGAGLSGGLLVGLPSSTAITSGTSSLSLTDFINLYAELPVLYRNNAVWYMHDNTRLVLHKLLETSARPSVELPTQLFGRPIAVCNSMPEPGAGVSNVVVLASPDYLQKRKAGSYIKRYIETPNCIEAGVVGFAGFMRADFNTALYTSPLPPVASLNQHA